MSENNENVKTGAASIAAAMQVSTVDPTEEELAALENEDERYEPAPMFNEPEQSNSEIPSWVVMPPDLKLPSGRVVAYMLFKAEWTDTPNRGDRHCLLWPLTSRDETIALKRTRGDSQRTLAEMAKQMIRAVDGKTADWGLAKANGAAVPNVEMFWNDIGAKCRQQITNYYLRTHSMTNEEAASFFGQCLHIRTVALERVRVLVFRQTRTRSLICFRI